MKKISSVFLTLLFLVSCSSDDDSSSTGVTIYGKWHQKEVTINNITIPYDDHEPCGKDYIEFYDHNKIRSVDVWNCEEDTDWIGTFTKTNNFLTLSNGIENRIVEIIELTSEALAYKYDHDENGDGVDEHYIEKFTRQ